jgi:hypothetical protein
MTTVGLLISLDTSVSCGVAQQLAAHPALTVGEAADRWLPVAVEAESDVECREVHDWIAAQPGVAYVDVVHVSFESEMTETPDLWPS